MQKFLAGLLTILTATVVQAATLKLDGDLGWKIRPPDCRFTLNGTIQNVTGGGTVSGTLKLVLWASQHPFPSSGVPVSEVVLGTLASGYQMADFSMTGKAMLPTFNGRPYFTIYVAEFTGSGWATRAFSPSAKVTLKNGFLLDEGIWEPSFSRPVVTPSKLGIKDELALRVRALDTNKQIVPSMCTVTRQIMRVSMKLEETSVYGKRTATRSHGVVRTKFRGKKVSALKLTVKYDEAAAEEISKTETLLFYQRARGGFYKCTALDTTGGRVVTWGTFSHKDN
ncbi:MAG: hypothetical protein V4733_04225 [Verrucomicrobiota bacterium]